MLKLDSPYGCGIAFAVYGTVIFLIGLTFLLGMIAVIALATQNLVVASKNASLAKISKRSRSKLPSAESFPFSKRKYFFSAAERSFYEVLRRLLPGHTVFAKVRLADIIYVTKNGAEWRSHQNRIDRKHLDFVICNADLVPVVAIELDDSSHRESDRTARDSMVDQALAAASLPIVRVAVRPGYQPDVLRQMLVPYLAA